MSDTATRNSISAEQIQGYVERIERIRDSKKALSDDEKLVKAEAKSAGFAPDIILHCVKVRTMSPSEYQEKQSLADLYLTALGMQPEPPLFRAAGMMSVDIAAREQVIEALKRFVPANGSITVEAGGIPVRLTRNKDGAVEQADVKPEPPRAYEPPSNRPASQKPEPLPANADEAEDLGRQAARDDVAIIKNPFPFGDPRRARWDLGWRREAGNDGMGPG